MSPLVAKKRHGRAPILVGRTKSDLLDVTGAGELVEETTFEATATAASEEISRDLGGYT